MLKDIKILRTELLSNNWHTLKKITFEYTKEDGTKETQSREVYDHGNAATILLYNKQQQTVILTRQFRLPSFINGNVSGMLIEACAGLLDDDTPEECAKREAEEETGYRVNQVQKIFESYMSAGSLTEIIHFFIAEYSGDMKVNEGGGKEDEKENIEVLELRFQQALEMIRTNEIKDAKTIMLLQYLRLQNIL